MRVKEPHLPGKTHVAATRHVKAVSAVMPTIHPLSCHPFKNAAGDSQTCSTWDDERCGMQMNRETGSPRSLPLPCRKLPLTANAASIMPIAPMSGMCASAGQRSNSTSSAICWAGGIVSPPAADRRRTYRAMGGSGCSGAGGAGDGAQPQARFPAKRYRRR